MNTKEEMNVSGKKRIYSRDRRSANKVMSWKQIKWKMKKPTNLHKYMKREKTL